MAKFITVAGTTSQIVHIFVLKSDTTDGSGLVGVTHSAAGLQISYIRPGDSAHAVVSLTGSGLNLGTYVSGAWIQVSSGTMPGLYEFHVPNAAVTTGFSRSVFMVKGAASMAQTPFEIELRPPTDIFTPILAATTHSGATIPIVQTVNTASVVLLANTVSTVARVLLVDTASLAINVNTCTTILGGTIGFASTAGTVLAGTIGFASTAGVVLGGTIGLVNTASVVLNVNTCTTVLGGTIGLVNLIATSGISAVAFRDDAISAASLSSAAVNKLADGTFDRVDAIETGLTLRQTQRLTASALAGKLTGGATTTIVIRNAVTDDKDRITATVDASGNRSAITYDLT